MKETQQANRTDLKFEQATYLPIWVEAFLVDRKASNKAAGTQLFYRDRLANFMAFCQSQAITQIDELTPGTIREYLLSLGEGHNPGGIHACYRALRAFLRWYELEVEPVGWKNPINKVAGPHVDQELLEPVSIETVDKMLDTCKGGQFLDVRDRTIIWVLLDTGLRASELLNLDVADVDPIGGGCQIKKGKGGKGRVVFLGKKTRKALRQYLRARSSSDPAVFVTIEGERLQYSGLRQVVVKRAKLAEVRTPSIHSFRRAFALNSLRNGMNVYSLQMLMGHSDLQILSRYLKQNVDDLARASREFGVVDHL